MTRSAAEILIFARDSIGAKVQSLTPGRWSDMSIQQGLWLLDFFAPWCPPCKAMMPEFRRSSNLLENVQFGTVDCVQHSDLCQKYNIQSYPTQLLLNGTKPHIGKVKKCQKITMHLWSKSFNFDRVQKPCDC